MRKDLDQKTVQQVVRAALEEDAAGEDITVSLLEIEDQTITANVIANAPGVLCGMAIAQETFLAMDPGAVFDGNVKDGMRLEKELLIARIKGGAKQILAAERVALNFLQRLSGIATLTSRFVNELSGTGVKILDTRKTAPLLRPFEKYAVRMGGGENHRYDLKEMVLVKENHIRAVGGIDSLIGRLQKHPSPVAVEVEVDSLLFLDTILGAPVDRVMLDNFSSQEVQEAIKRIGAYRDANPGFSLEVEVSGGITIENIRHYAIPGVDYISIGALTHSAPGLDMSLEVD
jgi:nicotinate-nucleotide pyrophosphorylase (carboxylating)